MMRWKAVGLVLLLVAMVGHQPITELSEGVDSKESPTNPTGVDVTVSGVSIAYTSSSDSAKYKMFSSNHPILGFNRPAELYVIDGMVNVSSTLTVTVENIGTASSGIIDVNVLLLHNEYTYFEFVNTTVQMSSLGGGNANTVTVPITPSYAGNHSMLIRATSTISDDVPSNDVLNDRFTVGADYFNCDSTTQWTLGSGWTLSSDTSISQGRSCHAGNGQSSNYNNNALSSMTTPVMDLSDAFVNPTRTNGISFFYTGSTAANDELTMYGKNAFGAWSEIGSITGTVDQTFTDGANWQTFSVSNKGAASPLLPVAQDLFHSTSQFKYEFSSDATGTDIGFYIDDIVMVYDQKVRPSEYNVSAQGVSTNGAIPGAWGSVTLKIINTGNITETFLPTLNGLPAAWNAYYSRPSGTSFDPLDGLMVSPGAPQEFNIMIQPDENATIGFQQMSVDIVSQAYPGVSTTLPIQFLVMADRIPVIMQPTTRPSCPPSYTCTFEIEMTNQGDATDVFDISLDTSNVPTDWQLGLAWTQASSVLIRPDESVHALFTLTVPENVAPDTVVSFNMRLQAQNDSGRFDLKEIDVSASMISVASVDLVESLRAPRMEVDAGERVVLEYKIWNNATRQDIFSMRVDVENEGNWIVHQPTRPNAVLNSGATTTFEIEIDVPLNAQANDRGPTITPIIESERSQMVIEGSPFDGLRVSTTQDISLELISSPTKLTPGIANEIELKVMNNGNGPTAVTIAPEELPETWLWWLTMDAENHTGAIDLTVSYDLEHEQVVSLWIMLPMSEAAGELHTLGIVAFHEGSDEDSNLDDNRVELVASTGAVRVPSLTAGEHSASAMAGGMIFAEALLSNTGNALEDRLSITASVSTSPPTSGLIVFFTIDGGDRAIGTPVDMNVPPGAEQRLRMEVLIPDDAPLNTRFVFRFDIDGALDENGFPKPMVVESMVMLDQQRKMEVDVARADTQIVPHGSAARVWVNHTSSSTNTEQFLLKVTGDDGWQVTCDKRLVNETGNEYELTPGHVTPQYRQHLCEVLRLRGPLSGDVMFTVQTSDGNLMESREISFEFQQPPADETLSSTVLVGGGIGLGVVVIALMAFMRRRPAEKEFDVEESIVETMSGPPVSTKHEAVSIQPENEPAQNIAMAAAQSASGPPLPESGLPEGWTEEQWAYYGQQYLDGTL